MGGGELLSVMDSVCNPDILHRVWGSGHDRCLSINLKIVELCLWPGENLYYVALSIPLNNIIAIICSYAYLTIGLKLSSVTSLLFRAQHNGIYIDE